MTVTSSSFSAPVRAAWLGDQTVRAVLYQALVAAAVAGAIWYLVSNTLDNLARQNIASGFGFLGRSASFAIGESLIDYSAADSYGRAIVVGMLNTLKVTGLSIVFATLIGVTVGISRLSSNWLLARLATVYVEMVRNVPLLLQLFLWYAIITENLPSPQQALNPLPGVFLSNRGLVMPVPVVDAAWTAGIAALLLAVVVSLGLSRWTRHRRQTTGRGFPFAAAVLALLLGLPLLVWGVFGATLVLDVPVLRGFNFRGGGAVSPELAALLLGLSIYTASYIAEIVRAGILAVDLGQTEAALALGLSPAQVLRLVVLPQALRVIVPPLTSQYLNLNKNCSLAVAIGYPDMVSVLNTIVNQTGQAVEGVGLIMGVYLAISVVITVVMAWYNRAVALVER
ncbi:putative ABC transporter membrane subunit YhdX [uncultured Gammaproteobacteria bacterium]